MKGSYSMDDECKENGEDLAGKVFDSEGTECVLIFSSMQIEAFLLRNNRPATKKRLNTVLKRSGDAFKVCMEHLVRRDYETAREIVDPYTNGDMPCLWICFSREEVVERVAIIYDRLSSSLSAHDAYALGGKEHVGTIVFWLDR